MTYGRQAPWCSGYCSGWLSFRLDYGEIPGLLQPLESALHSFRRGMDVPLRNHDAAVTCNSHDSESVHS